MALAVRDAISNGVAVGAHPGYPDREGFGRESGFMSGDCTTMPCVTGISRTSSRAS
jgi:lactam utilization protein B